MTLSFSGTTMASVSQLYLRLCVQKHTSYSILYSVYCTHQYLWNLFNNIIKKKKKYSSAMRNLCLLRVPFGGTVLLFGSATVCHIWFSPPRWTTTCYNVHRQFGSFSTTTKVSAMPEAPQRLGEYIKFAETCHCPSFKKLSKHDDQLSS